MDEPDEPRRATLDEFIRRCTEEHDCVLLKMDLMGPRGPEVSEYLVRSNGHARQCPLPRIDRSIPLPSSMLWSMCNRLGLSCADFGLFVG